VKNTEKNTQSKQIILVVEDDNFLANAYRIKLQNAGYEILLATNGEEALKILEEKKPHLMILDLLMPNTDGFSVLEKLQKDNKREMPILVATNLGQKEDFDRAKALGASDYVIKSNVSLDELLNKIQTLLKH